MKTTRLRIIIACILISGSAKCKLISEKDVRYDICLRGICFKEIKLLIDRKTGDTLFAEGLLQQNVFIEGFPCSGKISFTNGWNLKSFTLAEDHALVGNFFPKGTFIKLNVDVISLENHYFAVRGAGKYNYKIVHTCKFPSDQLVNDILCDKNEEAFFKTDWKLLVCILAEDDTIADNVFRKGTLIRFDEDEVIWCYCLYDPVIQGFHCSGTNYLGIWMGGGGIQLYPSGQLQYFAPMGEIDIQGVCCKHSSSRGGVTLYESGKLMNCISAKKQVIDQVLCGENFKLRFDEDGNLTYAKKEKIF